MSQPGSRQFILIWLSSFFGFTQANSWGRRVVERINILQKIRETEQAGSGRTRNSEVGPQVLTISDSLFIKLS